MPATARNRILSLDQPDANPNQMVEQIISQLVQTISQLVISERSSVWLWDSEEPQALVCAALYVHGQKLTTQRLRMPPQMGIAGWVGQYGQSLRIENASADPRFVAIVDQYTGFTTRAILAVPLIARNQVLGVLECVNKIDGRFDDHDHALAECVATYAAHAIENAGMIASLNRQRELLEHENEALDAFAHSVAHDLKNPLTLIVGFADLLRDGIATMPAESVRESLETIVEYSVKMSHIVDALLMLASVGADEEVDRDVVDMGEIIASVLRRMEHMMREYQAEVVGPVEWPAALGYGMWLEEIWFNYLSNGLKYGGRPPRLVLGYDLPSDGIVRFWVDDNGDGLDMEDPMTLFEPQPRRQRMSESNGHGLGLSIVQRIVDRLGGMVGVERLAVGGSRFSFTLPLAPEGANTE